MKVPSHPTLIRRFSDARITQLRAKGPVLAASLVQIAKLCGRPGCRCLRGHKHIGHYLTYKLLGKTHTVYVPKDLIPEVKQWINEHRRLRRLSQELTSLSIARVQTHVRARQRRGARF